MRCLSYFILFLDHLDIVVDDFGGWQPYVVKNKDCPGKNYGFDEALPDGIPSLPEYLVDYCAAAVSYSLLSFLVSEVRLGT